jgi:hypothetical protein
MRSGTMIVRSCVLAQLKCYIIEAVALGYFCILPVLIYICKINYKIAVLEITSIIYFQ